MTVPVVRCTLVVWLLALASCSRHEFQSSEGLLLHQDVIVANPGTPNERHLQVYEDARITPAMRDFMWGGPKDANSLLQAPDLTIDTASRDALLKEPLRRGLLRLVDRTGKTLDERRLDCELGQIATPELRQNDGMVWAVGDDCSSGMGDFAGLITRFLPPPDNKLAFETFRDATTSQAIEVTLVTAARIRWHLADKTNATLVHEVSSHPDYDDPVFKNLGAGQAVPRVLPWVVELVTYRWLGQGFWSRQTVKSEIGKWSADAPWPEEAQFPQG